MFESNIKMFGCSMLHFRGRDRVILIICLALSVFLSVSEGSVAAQTDIVFWNLENFFDYFDDGASSSDSDFSSRGAKRWTKKRFTLKCALIGKSLLWMGENSCPDGKPPEIVGIAEVENGLVLNRLVNSPVLRKLNYGYVHYESPDRRGIDVALLYRRDFIKVVSSRAVHVRSEDGWIMPTRDILYACVELVTEGEVSAAGYRDLSGGGEATSGGSSDGSQHIHILVNHHPSKFSGEKASMRGRELAMIALRDVCDSIARVSDAPVVAMGDFNDTPDGPKFSILEGRLFNLAGPLAAKGEGSIRYNGRWELIDHFLVGNIPCRGGCSENHSENHSEDVTEGGDSEGFPSFSMSVVQIPFLMTKDRAHTGFKPLRTYSGPRWLGGVSDHCPILLEFAP